MKKNIDEIFEQIRACYKGFLDENFEEIATRSYIAISNNDIDGTILSANSEGMLLIMGDLITLGKERKLYGHRHYDKHSRTTECDRPMIIRYAKAPWEEDE